MSEELQKRRQLKTRQALWAQRLAQFLVGINLSPNMVSVLSIFVALGAYLSLCQFSNQARALWLFLAVAAIQLRLLCNLMDGMIAIEGKKKSVLGDLYNDIPDRIADVLIILGMGVAIAPDFPMAMTLAWSNCVLAVFTAYLRFVGASISGEHKFLGPQAKQHRMALCTVALVVCALAALAGHHLVVVIYGALWIMAVGQVVTSWRRISWIANWMKAHK